MAVGRAILRFAGVIVLLYGTWLGMMSVHELGHIAHARISGGAVRNVSIPLLGFSQTFYRFDPHPHFVVWGGPMWGSVIPVLVWLAIPRRWRAIKRVIQFFAGFCLIANGSYLGVGWAMKVGDARELRLYGTPVWVMIAFGVIAISAGLYLWHLLGLPDRNGASPRPM